MSFIVKNTTFPGLLDLISPHSCRGCGLTGEPLCECCKKYILKTRDDSAFVSKCSPDLPTIYVVSNRNGLLGTLIHDYKYYSIRALARPLAELLDARLPQDLPPDSVLVPLPTATHHIRSRGFDHIGLITKHLGKLRHLPVKKVLIRNKNTTQVGSNREKRLSQASSAYILNPRTKVKPDTTYILLDDVWTTGASIKSAINILKKSGAKKIIVSILAYSS